MEKRIIPCQINKVSEDGKRFLPTDECTVKNLNAEVADTVTARYYKGVFSNNSNIVIEETRMEKVLGSVYYKVSDSFMRGLYPIARTVKAEQHDLAVVVMEEKEVKQIGNIYGFDGGNYAGNVYDETGIAPTIRANSGGNTQPMIVEKEVKAIAQRGQESRESVQQDSGNPNGAEVRGKP